MASSLPWARTNPLPESTSAAISTTAPASLVDRAKGRKVTKQSPSGAAFSSSDYLSRKTFGLWSCEPWSREQGRGRENDGRAGSPQGPVLAASSWLDQG